MEALVRAAVLRDTVPFDADVLLSATDARLAADARVATEADWRDAEAEDVRDTAPADVLEAVPEPARVDTPERVVPGERRLAPPVTVPLAIFLSREPHEWPAPIPWEPPWMCPG